MEGQWLSERARAAESAAAGGFDLTQCVREPIHLLGGVQSYGSLVAVDPDSGLVEVAARNTGEVLGVEADALVGTPVTRVVPAGAYGEALEATSGEEAAPAALSVVAGADGADRLFDVSAHRRDGLLVLEFEPREGDASASAGFHQGVRRALGRLRSAATVADCCRVAVREVRALTGYERVVAYRFDGEDGPGEVLAEDVVGGWEPWLGLWFPATDIPPQARRLYRENWIRVIADVDDATVGLLPAVRPATGAPLDLSRAALRTVSGFHLEYLRNIGVRSSMSVSVLREGRLWGLIACHGARPSRPAPEVRAACETFGAAFSLQLAAIEERERADALDASGARTAAVAALLADGLEKRLAEDGGPVLELLAADGVVAGRSGRTAGFGEPFPPELCAALERRARTLTPGSLWDTDRLSELGDEELGYRPPDPGRGPAGVLMVPLSDSGDFLAWCRRERPAPRRWAADPAAPVRVGPRGERLTPRGSGAVFRSTVRGRSLPWTTRDRVAARELWRLLTGLVLRHADHLDRLNEELRMTNDDLDSFAHAAAHDLKEPLRGISNAATFAIEDAATGLDATTLRRLHTMQRLAGRMDELLDSLLHYARLGRAGLRVRELDLGAALDAALEVAGPRLAEQGVEVVRGELPPVRADADRLYEVLVNLLVNAAKYARDGAERRVEVAVERHPVPAGADTVVAGAEPAPGAEECVLVVRDNGIGIAPEQQREVFDLFRRLHGPGERGGGTGVGLALVKRIVERHGGRLWLRSTPGEGTAFYIGLGGPPDADRDSSQ
ncbi:bacteriophytochrome [Streptomyces minutiscleroticus]|uniref:Sensor-like histidine kinase SenX3 n=1 Tax=Streptomyces minutiscleroticus TaxID=68238 RepID=A0A918NUL5_9ACTN|nr:ATP-binding protein [Streptomyces minutiscleroticus]GGX96375.1 bacteriophytochrome [Streptomyces minutiscleroticus]